FIARGASVKTGSAGAEGRPDSFYRATLATVTPNYIEFDEGKGKMRRVELEVRTAHVSWVKPMTIAASAPVIPNAGLSPEARQRLQAGQIDPAAVERARLAAAQALGGRNRATPSNPAANANGLAVPPAPGVTPTT